MKNCYLSIILCVLFIACDEDLPDDIHIQDYKACWNMVNDEYPFLEHKNIDWDSINDVYLPKAISATGDEIDIIIQDLLRELHDGHITFFTKGGYRVIPYSPSRFLKDIHSFSYENRARFFRSRLKLAMENTLEYEFLPDGIGYMKFSHFYEVFNENDIIREFDQVLKYFNSAKAVIIDVRHNMGGWAFSYIRRFNTDTIKTYQYYKHKKQPDYIVPFAHTFDKDIVILINGCTMSAGEDFAYFMGNLDNVTLVGDTTPGMAGNMKNDPYQLPSGKRVNIPISYPSLNGDSYEDYGVIPDILIPQTESDVKNGKDIQLEYAISYLMGKQ